MRLERTVAAQVIGDNVRVVPRLIPGWIVEHVARSDEFAVRKLKAEADHARRTIETGRRGLRLRGGHERAIVRAAHPALDNPGIAERLQHFAHGGEIVLRAHDHHRIVLAHVLAGDKRKAFGGSYGGNGAVGAGEDVFDRKATRRADKHQ